MRKLVLALLGVALLFVLKSCGEPYNKAKDVAEEFLDEIQEKEGKEALRYLHPSFRDGLIKDIRIPVQFTEMKPSEVLACVLSTMGANIDEFEVREGKLIGDRTALLKVSITDKSGIEKLFSFVLIKEGDRWLIADITPYAPPKPVGED